MTSTSPTAAALSAPKRIRTGSMTSCPSSSASPQSASELAALFDDFMQFGSVGLHIVDNNGIILWANQAELDLLGYTPDEYFGRPISDFHVDQAKLNTILSTLLGGRKVQNFIAPIRAKDGHTEYFQINSSMRQVNGQCVTTRCFSACVTDRVLREQAVLQALEEQKEAARVRQETARKTEFLRKLCHELCNPLAGVSGNLELLLVELQQAASICQKEEEQEQTAKERLSACQERIAAALDYAKSAQLAAEHQMLVINDTLSLSRLESKGFEFSPKPVDVAAVLTSVEAIMGVKAHEKDVTVTMSLDDAARTVRTDPVWLKQIIINLVSNAIKFTHAEGRVRVQVGCLQQQEKKREYDAENEEKQTDKTDEEEDNDHTVTLQVTVEDTGIGMTEQEQAKLFGVFAQANERISAQFGGSGLGLHIIKQLLDHVDGTITVQSQKGVGSTFCFTPPCGKPLSPVERAALHENNSNKSFPSLSFTTTTTSGQPQEQQYCSTSLPVEVAQGICVLVVDDSYVNRKILASFLKKRGYRHELAENGKIGLELHLAAPFDIILSDVDMPVMDGNEMTKRLRRHESEQMDIDDDTGNNQTTTSHDGPTTAVRVPIIGISGNVLPEDVAAARQVGMNEYVGKTIQVFRTGSSHAQVSARQE